MKLINRFREYLQRHNDLSTGRDPVWDATPTATLPSLVPAAEDAPTATMPSQVQAAQYDAEARRKVAELAAQVEAEQAQAAAKAWREADPIVSLPPAPPPPMPPSDLSRIMVAQIPSPPVNDRNAEWTHKYADYMRRVGVATGTATDLEHTIAWGIPALQPGDGSGVAL